MSRKIFCSTCFVAPFVWGTVCLKACWRPCLMSALQDTGQYQGLQLIPSTVSVFAGISAWGRWLLLSNSCLPEPAQPFCGDHTNIFIGFAASITSTTATVWKAVNCSWATTSVGQVKMLEYRLVLPFQIRWANSSASLSLWFLSSTVSTPYLRWKTGIPKEEMRRT